MSLLSVLQARKIAQRSLLPVLTPFFRPDGSALALDVGNASKTVAVAPGWAVVWSDRRAEGKFSTGFVKPDDVVRVSSVMTIRAGIDELNGDRRPIALVWCRDAGRDVHLWSSEGGHWLMSAKKVRGKRPVDLLASLVDPAASLE